MTTIQPCTCEHAYQDATYGEGMRVHNKARNKNDPQRPNWVCTVCGKRK